ncbi:hypothetical protein Q8W71_27295 [Methylobacterium sp. NEAU 140]|uniref:hypothetical protein n=1 Tax=Methylobacterium sp. NEAU 140 TaxID=3064945 RepID=UPI002734D9E7|nr:hypothetical protein [Methylobacterium sp. NEAU 140]MDP4026334.1 hypothetical protein [Methylobacterium sp. NEAU 140]
MKAPAAIPNGRAIAPLVFDHINEAASTAAAYADTVATFAAIGDIRGVAYGLRSAAAALAAASAAAQSLRPSSPDGGAA